MSSPESIHSHFSDLVRQNLGGKPFFFWIGMFLDRNELRLNASWADGSPVDFGNPVESHGEKPWAGTWAKREVAPDISTLWNEKCVVSNEKRAMGKFTVTDKRKPLKNFSANVLFCQIHFVKGFCDLAKLSHFWPFQFMTPPSGAWDVYGCSVNGVDGSAGLWKGGFICKRKAAERPSITAESFGNALLGGEGPIDGKLK